MLEAAVEAKLGRLEQYGFEVFKLRTPGKNGAMDRLILWPTWSPAPPAFVEMKRPGKSERPLQIARRDNWRARGCDVRDACDTIEDVVELCDDLLLEAVCNYMTATPPGPFARLPEHIRHAYILAHGRQQDRKDI